MRFIAFLLLATTACAMVGTSGAQQPEKKQPAKGKYDPPESLKPDAATLETIANKTARLRDAIADLQRKKLPADAIIEIEIFLKAAENIVRFDEWFAKGSVKWALTTLDRGLERAKQLAETGRPVWREARGKWIVRAYRSEIDGSIQPYAVLLPADYGKDPKKEWRLDIVLHGRDSSLTEAKFISSHDANRAGPKDLDHVQLEVYGRGNNAYRWAGEMDVHEAVDHFVGTKREKPEPIDSRRIVLRGFSMGGAGTWHLGLHHPFDFAVIGPGAGFTNTHGYIGGLPAKLPDHQEKCLRIYDAVDYAENAFNVPVVAYSGSNDPQKAAADNIEQALTSFREPLRFKHVIAPGLKHEQPREWQEKLEVEYRKYANEGRKFPERVRFVTYTPRYNDFDHGFIEALEKTYEKAIVDSRWTKDGLTIATQNVAAMRLISGQMPLPEFATIDGAKVALPLDKDKKRESVFLVRENDKWNPADRETWFLKPHKRHDRQGPIDDAFMDAFAVVPPSRDGSHTETARFTAASHKQFAAVWERYFRGKLPERPAGETPGNAKRHLVLFGDPASNPDIAAVLPKLPITWTKEKLVVNGVEYDAATHVPVLITLMNGHYVVINSGHTFSEADLKDTNARLYPRLGDWAVLKVPPEDKDSTAYTVVAAGLFDEQWQFPKK
jgi:dienelactone hydrolase